MVKIGMMIGERYEILEKIGTGGMSDVYKAKCHKLNRMVAVKVLKSEFAENANFVSRFTVEAQAAAGLMHPNIVNVYDVGEDNGINYIVMELVEGITLKKYIEKKARLSVKEAVTIAIQIGMGIEAAHNNHIIHRDIKPQNVIISKEGKVKVTDFGIAKAATSNTITSNVMGSVHYTSPEQARGGFSDEKSDVYSLGITLFEMLTGRVPFNGETTVAIAIKQIQEQMPSPREYVDDIPVSVEQIVLKCTQKSPDRRYQNMGALIDDLKKSFTTPDEDFVNINAFDEIGETRPLTDSELETLKNTTKSDAVTTGTLPKVNPNVKDSDEGYDKKLEKITTILAIVVGAVILFIAVFLIVRWAGAKKPVEPPASTDTSITSVPVESTEQVKVPALAKKSLEDAQKILDKLKLHYSIEYEESDEFEENVVISTNPEKDSTISIRTLEGVNVGEKPDIIIIVSSGKSSVTVPTVVGYSLNAANRALIEADLKPEIIQEYSDEVPEGNIISQSIEGGKKAPKESTIVIKVSLGAAEDLIIVPNILGKTYDDAVLELTELGFAAGVGAQVYNNAYAEGYVCYQNITPGSQLPKGSVIDLQVSKGPEPIAQVLYRFNSSISAPTVAEDPDYSPGSVTEVKVVITGLNGKELSSTVTSSFPHPINLWNISGCNGGTVTLTYDVKKTVMQKVIDVSSGEETDEEIVVDVYETHTIKRDVIFEIQE